MSDSRWSIEEITLLKKELDKFNSNCSINKIADVILYSGILKNRSKHAIRHKVSEFKLKENIKKSSNLNEISRMQCLAEIASRMLPSRINPSQTLDDILLAAIRLESEIFLDSFKKKIDCLTRLAMAEDIRIQELETKIEGL